jgi:DNA-binding winged helix-turn-helix (wHTH) protein
MDEGSFAFGSFRLLPAQRMLLEEGKPLRLASRALDILVTLIESAGETIRKDQLIVRTWQTARRTERLCAAIYRRCSPASSAGTTSSRL